MGQCKMKTAECLLTIVFRVRKQWDYCCQVLITHLILILFLCFIEGQKFISFFITVTCLPSLNKGVTLPYLTLPYYGNEW